MIRHAVIVTLLAASFSAMAFADEIHFPYEATIAGDNVYVRSGPGKKYYPTNKLNRGERVVVRRHDPGAWYMIEPPRGAFSWIRAEYVNRSGKNRGTVTQNDVRVHVGSEFGPDHDTYSQTLSTNDTVEIIGEETLQEPDRSIRMFKIVPPRYEYRWINGRDVIPSDASVRREHDRDPYAVPSNARHDADPRDSYAGIHDGDDEHHHRHAPRGKGVQEYGPGIDVMAAEKEQLRRLDEEFRRIVHRETRYWDLAEIEDDYRDLYDAVERPAMKKQLAMRLDAVERYSRVKAEYDEFVELTSATNWRDERLLSIDRRHAGRRGPVQSPLQNVSTPQIGEAPPPRHDGIPTMPPISVPGPHHDHGPFVDPVSHETKETPFDGAGVIQRATYSGRGVPQHVLLSPNGKILAYLQPEAGVNLDKHIGESMGVRGKRWHRPDLNTDFIVVRKLTPVRLIP